MKKDFARFQTLSIRRVGLGILCCFLLAMLAAPGWAEEVNIVSDNGICNGALFDGALGQALGCGAVIVVTSVDGNGNANAFNVLIPNNQGLPANGNPYDYDDDILVGIVNNSTQQLALRSITLTSSDLTFGGIFGFDGDGPCNYLGTGFDCFNAALTGTAGESDPFDYEGPVTVLTPGASVQCTTTESQQCYPTGTVTFAAAQCDGTCTPVPSVLAPGAGTWFALEGTPNSLVLTSEMQTLTFTGGTNNQTQTATFGSGNSQHTASFTIPTVKNTIQVNETANYVDTEFSNGGTSGPGIVDGVCEYPPPVPVPDNDIDCRLAAGGFVFFTETNGDQIVPHAFPYHNGQAVWYRATTTAIAGTDYVGPVTDAWTWETKTPLTGGLPLNQEYSPGWNNQNGRVYDRPGVNPANPFVADITTFFQGEPGAGGKQATLNDWVIAAIPNPQTGGADQEITLLPLPPPIGPSPAPYIKGLPMPVSFTLLNTTTKKLDPNALKFPNTVNISTQDLTHGGTTIPIQFLNGFPTTFQCVMVKNVCTGVYGIVLSSTPYQKNTLYNLQIGSDLFSAPVNIPFVVK